MLPVITYTYYLDWWFLDAMFNPQGRAICSISFKIVNQIILGVGLIERKERLTMNNLILRDSGALTVSDSDRIRIAAAWEALSVNSRRSYQGAWDRCGEWLTDRGISLDDLSDELMAVYIATLDAKGRTPATISVSVAAVKWFFAHVRNEERNWQTTENKLRLTVEISRTTRSLFGRARQISLARGGCCSSGMKRGRSLRNTKRLQVLHAGRCSAGY